MLLVVAAAVVVVVAAAAAAAAVDVVAVDVAMLEQLVDGRLVPELAVLARSF